MILETLPAAKGDCLLLHHGRPARPRLTLIDGGPAGVYSATLRPRLLEIREKRVATGRIDEADPLDIDLLVVSHIDDDHINGVKALLQDIADRDAPFRVSRIWHNSFDSLLGAERGQVAVPSGGDETTASIANVAAAHPDAAGDHDLLGVLASVQQGHDVLALAKRLGIPVNPEFEGRTIAAGAPPLEVDGLKVTVLGPLEAELADLREAFARWLRERASHADPAASLLATFSDTSVPNLSSIVLLVEDGAKRTLLTGDARGDKIMAACRQLGLLDGHDQLQLDVLKVPHHGSYRNTTAAFFEMFPARRYVFSGNGEHGNPERRTFEYLAEALANRAAIVELTYPPAQIDRTRELEWRSRRPGQPYDAPAKNVADYLSDQENLALRVVDAG